MEKSLNFIGLIKKAGKLEIGTESVEAAAGAGKAKLILSAADASKNSIKQAQKAADLAKTEHIVLPYEKSDIGAMVGRGLPGMLAVTDEGFASALAEKLNVDFSGRYDDTVKKLAEADTKRRDAAAAMKPGKRRK